MSKTWRRSPVGAPKEPRPPEKGGKRNILREPEYIINEMEEEEEVEEEEEDL